MSDFYLVHQKQPNGETCACTCVAMLSGATAQKVIDGFHQKYFYDDVSMEVILAEMEFAYEIWSPFDKRPIHEYPPGAALCSVPSLTRRGGLHYVLIEKSEDNTLYRVLDPQMGNGCPYYATEADPSSLAAPLISWEVHAFFPLDNLKARRLH